MSKGKLLIAVGQSDSSKTKQANEIILSKCIIENDGIIPNDIWPKDSQYTSYLAKLVADSGNITFLVKKYITGDTEEDEVGTIKCSKKEIESKCDIIVSDYEDNDLIGINLSEIINQIDNGKFPVLDTSSMEFLQLILQKFYNLGRLDDVYTIGMNNFSKTEQSYIKLEQDRYGESESSEAILKMANKRFEQAKVFAIQYIQFMGIF